MAFDAMVAHRYLEQLSESDLALLVAGRADLAREGVDLRARPGLLTELLADPKVFSSLVSSDERHDLSSASPFLVFSLIIEQVARDVASRSYVAEWIAPGRRMPIFDGEQLARVAALAEVRLFLSELLSSFTKVRSGSVVVATRRRGGLRRQRFSELDPVRLAGLLEVVPEAEHPGVYRRLGDLALFLTGVFPDHLARHGFSSIERGRLVSSTQRRPRTTSREWPEGPVELLSELGRSWYGLAHDLVAPPLPRSSVLSFVAPRFFDLRRLLGTAADHYLFAIGDRFFGIG